jgi:hypothetical protein
MPGNDDGEDDDDEHFNTISALMSIAESVPVRGRVAFLGLIRCMINDLFAQRGLIF